MRFVLLLTLLAFTFSCHRQPANPASSPVNPAPAAAQKSDERYRPLYHFTPKKGWMNDPNGLVYHAGEWHLFFQYYPDGNRWGPMHWGHAVSTDLLNWEELPIALYPDELGYIFSGSAIVDTENRSGFGIAGEPPLVAVFTYHDTLGEKAGRTDYETQGLAYSNDRGRTWAKYAGNPVIPNNGSKDFRDPKVFWDEQRREFTLVLAAADHVEFYASPDLKTWTYLSSFGTDQPEQLGVWECPELVPMTVEDTGEQTYLLIVSTGNGNPAGGSGTYYYVGDWDGTTFTKRQESDVTNPPGTKWLDYGRDNYAAVTFAGTPGRTVLLGWMSNWQYAQDVPTETWRSAMTLPRELSLYDDPDFGLRLRQTPVPEATAMRGEPTALHTDYLKDGLTELDLTELPHAGVFELDLAVDLHGNSESLYFTLTDDENRHFYRFGFDRQPGSDKWLFTDRDQAGRTDFSDRFATEELTYLDRFTNSAVLDVRVFFDRTSAELFLDGGRTVVTDIFFPEAPFTKLVVEVSGGQRDADGELGFSVDRAVVYPLSL